MKRQVLLKRIWRGRSDPDSYRGSVAAVQLKCEIDGCGQTWSVASPAKMKASMDAHRTQFHPDWVQPASKPMTPYRLDYSGRTRQF